MGISKENKKKYDKEYRKHLRAAILAAYGNKCSCCGETNNRALQVDHINGGGRKHVNRLKGSKALYKSIIDSKYPAIFQLLCANCNLGKYRNYGICPHIGTGLPPGGSDESALIYRAKLRIDAYFELGNRCVGCGCDGHKFLTIDHVDGGGKIHRGTISDNEVCLRQIRDKSNVIKFQLMCMNCNLIKYFNS